MANLIDKDALVAWIRSRLHPVVVQHETNYDDWDRGADSERLNILSFINTLEVKEVDNVWHDASETPKGAGDKEILVQFSDFHTSVLEIDDWEYLDHQTKWAYLKDLT